MDWHPIQCVFPFCRVTGIGSVSIIDLTWLLKHDLKLLLKMDEWNNTIWLDFITSCISKHCLGKMIHWQKKKSLKKKEKCGNFLIAFEIRLSTFRFYMEISSKVALWLYFCSLICCFDNLQAWKKRWFILRSGRMSGDPDVLEYYKNDHAKKPIRIIDLHCCEQVDAGLTFKRKEFQDSFVFDIKTAERTFYLVAETEDEMNRWVRSICQLCGFNQSEDNHGE